MGLLWEDRGWEDYLYWQTQDKKTLKKINKLIKDAQRNPYEGIGKPEPLGENLSGFWSRRINEQDRLIYDVTEDGIRIIACKGHYE
ncbi:MAG: Txe/YoeB family addiction module toxin [Lachnospiraceae bacterium]|nr:Txe/YoeB family addiction module toxin [Lachnospiraceae bacterium]